MSSRNKNNNKRKRGEKPKEHKKLVGRKPKRGDDFFASHDDEDVVSDEEVIDKNEKYDSDSDNSVGGKQRRKDGDDFFIGEDDQFATETPDERRLRLAKQYVDKVAKLQDEIGSGIRSETRGIIEDDDEEERNLDPIAKQLRREALRAKGLLSPTISNEIASHKIIEADIRHLRGHHASVTCLALTADDRFALTGSKDCCVIKWDIETGRKDVWKGGRHRKNEEGHTSQILSIAVSTDGRYVATTGRDKKAKIWDCRIGSIIGDLEGHRGDVNCVAFQMGTHQCYTGSSDRTVKVWNVDEMGYVDTLYGHSSIVHGIDAMYKEVAVTCGDDRSVRVWKVPEETQLLLQGGNHTRSIDSIKMLTEDLYVTGSQCGRVAIWSIAKKKPLYTIEDAHGGGNYWISAVGALKFSNVCASGSHDGLLKLWRFDKQRNTLSNLKEIPMTGFVNGIAFSSTGRFLVAGIGQEHRLGRWFREKDAKNGICIVNLLGK